MISWLPRWFAGLGFLFPSVILAPLAIPVIASPHSQTAPPAESDLSLSADLKLLKEAGVQTDGPSLVEFFRKQTVNEEQRRRIAEWIKQLGDNRFKVRETAARELTALGHAAVPALRQALDHPDVEVARRAKDCLNALGRFPPTELRAAAVRVLMVRKPREGVEVLLAFLPDAADTTEEDRIVAALLALGVRDGKVDAALLGALTDRLPLRRAVAGEVLAAVGATTHRAAVRKLLTDVDRGVRLHVAVALTHVRDRDAIPVLIDLTADLPREQTREAQELLRVLAGDKAPRAVPEGQAAARQQYRDAWNAWWKEQGAAVDLARVEATPPSKARVAARASSTWAEMGRGDPNQAFAFVAPKGWNAGGHAPQWIEADLAAPARLASLWMNPSQLPAVCDTTHEIWVSDEPIGDERTKAKLVHTFKGQTESGHALAFAFPKGLSARYVQIRTTASASWVSWSRIELQVGRTRSRFLKEVDK